MTPRGRKLGQGIGQVESRWQSHETGPIIGREKSPIPIDSLLTGSPGLATTQSRCHRKTDRRWRSNANTLTAERSQRLAGGRAQRQPPVREEDESAHPGGMPAPTRCRGVRPGPATSTRRTLFVWQASGVRKPLGATVSGGVAALDHRLPSGNPPGSGCGVRPSRAGSGTGLVSGTLSASADTRSATSFSWWTAGCPLQPTSRLQPGFSVRGFNRTTEQGGRMSEDLVKPG